MHLPCTVCHGIEIQICLVYWPNISHQKCHLYWCSILNCIAQIRSSSVNSSFIFLHFRACNPLWAHDVWAPAEMGAEETRSQVLPPAWRFTDRRQRSRCVLPGSFSPLCCILSMQKPDGWSRGLSGNSYHLSWLASHGVSQCSSVLCSPSSFF